LAQLPLAAASQTAADRNYSDLMGKQNVQFLRQLQNSLKNNGYEHARVIPQLFVAVGNRPGQAPTAILVDYNTMQIMEIQIAVEFANGAMVSHPETDLPKIP
jgi:hypothetical protein